MQRLSKYAFLFGGLTFFSIFSYHQLAPFSNDHITQRHKQPLPEENLDIDQGENEIYAKTTSTPEYQNHGNVEEPIQYSIERRMEIISERRDGITFPPERIQTALQQTNAWKESKNIPQNLPLENEDLYDGRVFIQTDPLKFETLLVGDELPFTIPQTDSQHMMKVSQTKYNGGIVIWEGEIDDGEGRFSITRDLSFTSGQVVTPEGTYHFEFHDDIGWIHSQGALFKHQEVSDMVSHPNH